MATCDPSVTCIRNMNITVHVSDFCSVSQHMVLSIRVAVHVSEGGQMGGHQFSMARLTPGALGRDLEYFSGGKK